MDYDIKMKGAKSSEFFFEWNYHLICFHRTKLCLSTNDRKTNMYVLNVIIDHVVEVYYKLTSCRRRIGKSGIEINFGSFWSGKYL